MQITNNSRTSAFFQHIFLTIMASSHNKAPVCVLHDLHFRKKISFYELMYIFCNAKPHSVIIIHCMSQWRTFGFETQYIILLIAVWMKADTHCYFHYRLICWLVSQLTDYSFICSLKCQKKVCKMLTSFLSVLPLPNHQLKTQRLLGHYHECQKEAAHSRI